jgi:hypothetical protein
VTLPAVRAGRIAAGMAVALAIGACGDSDGGSTKGTSVAVKPSSKEAPTGTTTTTTKSKPAAATKKITRTEVIAKGDQACVAAKRKTNRLDRVGTTADQIAALESQTDDPRIAKYVNVLNLELGLLRRLSVARKNKKSSEVDFILAALAKQRHRARVLAADYGFKSCGSG